MLQQDTHCYCAMGNCYDKVHIVLLLLTHVSSKSSSNSEANASELLEDFEGMFPRCHKYAV